ncbi:MAG TPA: hypothetical protein VFK57_09205 [Vicinamibacterales bacterium]|nr:hypothetical protein [Vicinamibacterales bacterium]
MRRLLIVAALLLAAPAGLRATVVIPIEFRELVTTTPIIVHGHVTDVRAAFVDGRRSVDTFVTVAADEYLKGDLGDYVTFRVPGGELGRYRTIFLGAPEFRVGEEVVLFLKTLPGQAPFVAGLNQGAYRIVENAQTRQRMVTSPVVMSRDGVESEPVVRGAAARRPIAYEAFRDIVRGVLAKGAAK